MRREIHEGLNVVEQWNGATDFVFFARRGEMASNRREDHEISMLSLHLIQNCMVYINTLMIQKVLARPRGQQAMTPRDYAALTPLIWSHVNPYRRFDLDMNARIALPWNNNPRKLPSAGNSGGTAARISVSHTGSRTAPRHQCPNADCGPGQTCIRATRTTARTASLPETNTLYTIPRTHAAACCSLRVRAPAPPGWKLA